MNGNPELENQLRAMLHERATEAPPGDGVADRVLAEVAGPPAATRSRRGWGTWTMPLLAAAAVVAVIASVLGVSRSSNTAEPAHPSIGATPSVTPPTSDAVTSAPNPAPTGTRSMRTTSAPTAVQWDQVGGGAPLNHFRATDATFYGTTQAWLLGSADCITGPVRPCAAMAHTGDAGRTWQSVPNPPGNVTQIRFANPKTGYAFGPSRLEMTTDGADWTRESGGAVALETLDDNVIRVAQRDPSCVGLCTDVVETSAVGGNLWMPSKLAAFKARGVELQRTHGHAFLLVRDSGTPGQPSTSLFTSNDGGIVWQPRTDQCTKIRGGFTAVSMAVGTDGASMHLLCRNTYGRWAISSDGRRGTLPPGTDRYPLVELGASDAQTLFVVADRLYRSADGGQTWHAVLRYAPNADLGPPEFENGEVGRWFTDGGRVVWTTKDSGRTWQGVSFSS
jgi:photosystem II stability/assembly factor-like uncharacterized protein